MKKKKISRFIMWSIGVLALCAVLGCLFYALQAKYEKNDQVYQSQNQSAAIVNLPIPFAVTHLPTPIPLKGIYMTSWVAGISKLRDKLIGLIDTTELNTVVIDVKDYTGKISFIVEDPNLKAFGSAEERIPNIKEFIGMLHDKGIYVVGRISVFQDSYLVKTHPEYAVKTKDGKVWKDFKGVSWLDAGAEPVWDYIALIGNEAYSVGFDELNFDYIRFPSDGNMKDIAYSYSKDRIKSEVLNDFFAFIGKTFHAKGIPISADLFGMTTSNYDDLGIGQIFENALAHFDFVSPMVYPSHYPPNFNGWKNPAAMPYETVLYAMTKAYNRSIAASTTPTKLRPWLQDFSINGTHYTPEMVKLQKKATYDSGLTSWMMWSAANTYTASAFDTASTTGTHI